MITILIVEDEIVLQDVYKLILDAKGYKVVTASNGHEGLREMKKSNPQLVLLDMYMPVMDGKEFMRNLDLSNFPGTKIVIYTNNSDHALKKEMLEMGAEKFVLKSSMAPNDLVDLVTELTS